MFPVQRLFSPALLAATLAGPALAQTTPADTAHFYKHHLGLTASPQLDHFFTANRSLPVGLLYKHQTKPGRLLRLGLEFNQRFDTRNDPAEPIQNDEYNINRFSVGVRVGREYTYALSRRWVATTGVDILAGYERYAIETIQYQDASVTPGETPIYRIEGDRDNTYRLAALPFIGLRYSFHKKLYVSAESVINISYIRSDHRGQSLITYLKTGVTTSARPSILHDQRVSAFFQPVSQLTLHYLL